MKTFLCLLILFFSYSSFSARGWGLGVSYLYGQMNYKEPALMSEKGKMIGLGLDARLDLTSRIVATAQAKIYSGNLEYSGSTFSGVPISQTTKDKVNEYRGLLALRFGQFQPYSGYGYRYWFNDLVISYRRETTYHYIPIGIKYVYRPFYFNYEFRHFLDGVNVSYMSDVSPARKDVTMKQKSGKGYAFEVGHLTKVAGLDLKISVAYEYWGIEKSETSFDGVDNLIEPHNSTNMYTLAAGLFF
jgi:hypothetical protein